MVNSGTDVGLKIAQMFYNFRLDAAKPAAKSTELASLHQI
jgi:hypothetical protein